MGTINTLQDIDPELFADHVIPDAKTQPTASVAAPQNEGINSLEDIDKNLFGANQAPVATSQKEVQSPSIVKSVGDVLNQNIPASLAGAAGAVAGLKYGEDVKKPSGYDTAQTNLGVAGQAQERRRQALNEAISSHGNVIDMADLEHQAKLGALESASEQLRSAREAAREANLPIERPVSQLTREQKTGVQNYGEKFGLSAMDAAKAEDMSKAEKGVWDIKKKVAEAEAKIGPNYRLNEEVGLVLPKGMNAFTPEQQVLIDSLRSAENSHDLAAKEVAAAQHRLDGLRGSDPRSIQKASADVARSEEAMARATDRLGMLEKNYPGYAKFMNSVAPVAKAGLGALSAADFTKAYQEATQAQPNWPGALMHGAAGLGGLGATFASNPVHKAISSTLMAPALMYDVGVPAMKGVLDLLKSK